MKFQVLLKNDVRQIWKDPMLMASLLGPIAVIAFAQFLFPLVSVWLESQFGFVLLDYSHFAVTFLMVTIPLLSGCMAGLLMLDERDENMISYYSVTPLTRKGYFQYRLFLPSFLSLLLSSLFFLLSGISVGQIENLYSIVLLTLETPCLAIFLAAFATNKVEGLALSKISALLFVGPIIATFVPVPWQYIGMWIPTYWPAKSYLLAVSDQPLVSLGVFAIGLVIHLALLKGMYSKLLKPEASS